VLLLGGGLGNAVLFSIAKAMREHGNKVIYFAGYKRGEDLFKREDIEAATDQVIWSTDMGASITPSGRRTPTSAATSSRRCWPIRQASWARAGAARVRRSHHCDRLGPDDGGGESGAARRAGAAILKPEHVGIGSINSPMQCMMKEVCAQCLQKHVDPATGVRRSSFPASTRTRNWIGRLPESGRPAATEHRAGKAQQPVVRPRHRRRPGCRTSKRGPPFDAATTSGYESDYVSYPK
jgi:hypothetical protein